MHIYAKTCQENHLRMVRWIRWHCPPDTGFEIRAPVVWDRARYLSVTGGSQQYLTFMRELGRNIFFLWNLKDRVEFESAITNFPSRQLWPLPQGLALRNRTTAIYLDNVTATPYINKEGDSISSPEQADVGIYEILSRSRIFSNTILSPGSGQS